MAITSPNYAAKQFSRCLLCVVLCSNYAEVNVTMTRSISGTGRSVCKLHFLFQCFSFLFHLNTFSFRLSHLTINLAIATMQRWAKKKLLHSKLIIVNLRMYTRSLITSLQEKSCSSSIIRRSAMRKKEKVDCITRGRRIVQGEEFNWANFSRVSTSRHKRKKKDFFSRSWSITWERAYLEFVCASWGKNGKPKTKIVPTLSSTTTFQLFSYRGRIFFNCKLLFAFSTSFVGSSRGFLCAFLPNCLLTNINMLRFSELSISNRKAAVVQWSSSREVYCIESVVKKEKKGRKNIILWRN